jgi:hypothetical protein
LVFGGILAHKEGEMKWMFGMAASVFLLGTAPAAMADGCFLCEGGGYVKYTGDDTFDKRKKAKEKFNCKVSGTTSSCSNPKGTVSYATPLKVSEVLVCKAETVNWSVSL